MFYSKTGQYFAVLTTVEMPKKKHLTDIIYWIQNYVISNQRLDVCEGKSIEVKEAFMISATNLNLMDFNMRYLSDGQWKFIAKNFSRFISEINATHRDQLRELYWPTIKIQCVFACVCT